LLEAEVNTGEPLSQNIIIATIDVCGLYTNNPIDEGLEAVKEALEQRVEKRYHQNSLLDWNWCVNITSLNSINHFINTLLEPQWAPNVHLITATSSWQTKWIQK
jgi:hypothetical protein